MSATIQTEKTIEQNVRFNEEEEEEEPSFNVDILESVLSRVPLIDLVQASYVSKPWNLAAFSSLRHINTIKPWLLLHRQSTRSPYKMTTHAYDPRSQVWIEIMTRDLKHESGIRSSHSSILYTISPSKFSFSVDPLHLTWHHVDASAVWRLDPIVAVVDGRVIVASGTHDFEDDKLAVEILDVGTGKWEKCESMPELLTDSPSASWISSTVHSGKLFVTEKNSGLTYSFDPNTKTWSQPYDLRRDGTESENFVIGSVENRLILVGITVDDEMATEIKIWEVNIESFNKLKLIGEMPKECIGKLKAEDSFSSLSSVTVDSGGGLIYFQDGADPGGEIVVCEMIKNGCLSNWRSLEKVNREELFKRSVATCAKVSLTDLRTAFKDRSCTFSVMNVTS